jgi:hypothetical protein
MKPDNNKARRKFNDSIVRTVERFEGKLALMAEWEAAAGFGNGEAIDQLQRLRREVTKLRSQLRVKGVLFKDVAE